MWLTIYLWGWLVSAIAVFVVADTHERRRAPSPLARGGMAILAGAVWPVLVVGLLELACIIGLARRMRTTRGVLAAVREDALTGR